MKLRQVKLLNPFQRLVLGIVHELWRRGYDLYGATDERIVRIACTVPACREALNESGLEWDWPDYERHRIAEVVRYNVAMRESRLFAFGETMDLESQPCAHGRRVYCSECWLMAQSTPPGKRRRLG
jgi:hypothetical protein